MSTPFPCRIEPSLQHYAWGDEDFLPRLLGLAKADGPYAEAWFGAHPAAPARACLGREQRPLDAVVAEHREAVLGPTAAETYANLPYLLKVLAAGKPLSIQVHPTREQAVKGFAREERLGIPRDAKHRSYRDDNHKPEALVALTEFYALAGFRQGPDLVGALDRIPELARLLPPLGAGAAGLRSWIESYFALPETHGRPALNQLLQRLAEEDQRKPFDPSQPEYWALLAHRELSPDGTPDRGLLFVFLLNLVELRPGEAIYTPAGVPHAYLRGAGVELMATSDNVLRAGLTSKHVDVPELLRVVRFDAGAPPVLSPVVFEDGREAVYPLPVEELDIRRWTLAPGARVEAVADGPTTLLAMTEGRVRVAGGDLALELRGGQACLIPHGARFTIEASDPAQVFVASTPATRPSAERFRGRTPTTLAFGTSGLRGLVDDITDLEAYINTRGFLEYLIARGDAVAGMPVALAGDLRPSTERILRAVARAASDTRFPVVYGGRIPTPALTYYGLTEGIPSVMVTGSHIPFDRNGIKFNKPRGEVLKTDEAPILFAVARVREREYRRARETSLFDDAGFFQPESAAELPAPDEEPAERYRRRYLDAFAGAPLSGVRVGFYQHSAVGRDFLAEILHELGAEVFPAGRSDRFVAIDTEAVTEDRLRELQDLVDPLIDAHGRLDAIVSTDGDSDRPLLVGIDADHRVRFFGGDLLGAIVADYLGADAIAIPVSSNDAIDRWFANRRVPVERTRIGSPYVIAGMAAMAGEKRVGWEANGGFLVGTAIPTDRGRLDPLPTRDAILPLIAALHAARRAGLTLIELFARLPGRYSRAGLLDQVAPPDSQALLRRFGLGSGELRAARFHAEGVTVTTFSGETRPAKPPAADRLHRVREDLQRTFSAERGFGPIESIDALDGLRVAFAGGDIAHVRPSGNAPQLRIYAVADSEARAEAIVADALREPDGLLRELLAAAARSRSVEAITANIAAVDDLLAAGELAPVIGVVCGSREAQSFWQRQLDLARPDFGAREAIAFHEDLPVNQAFGLLLLWQRLRPRLQPGEGALVSFVFGEGTRSTPFTEAECGQKPAIASFRKTQPGPAGRLMSVAELALRMVAPVEAYLRRSGFSGMVVKWGDEIQIPTQDLRGTDPLFRQADVVRFVSLRPISGEDSASKDWVGVDEHGRVTAFIPRRPLADMEALADRGLLIRREGRLFGGVNLGSIALSRALLDVLLEGFSAEVNDPCADRKTRPDLDPQLFTALTIAAIRDPDARSQAWAQAQAETPAMRTLAKTMPDVVNRLVAALERFEARHQRPVRMVAMDFQDPYWGDIGQHRKMYDFYLALAADGPEGEVARALAGIPSVRDGDGNIVVGASRIGPGARVRDSVLLDAQVDTGALDGCVLIGTHVGELTGNAAFDIESCAPSLTLAPRSGTYKVVSRDPIAAGPGERLTTVFLAGEEILLRVHEDADLRDRKAAYDVPLHGNPLSFRDAHLQASAVPPEEVEQRRTALRQIVERIFE